MPLAEGGSRSVGIIDYGLGNLFNVERGLRHVGGCPHFVKDRADLLASSCLILPGVGAFGDGVKGLKERGFWDPLQEYVASGKPLLGICLGMQLLFESSSEFGWHPGLGFIPGAVEPLVPPPGEVRLKLPHIGWAPLAVPAGGAANWNGMILDGIRAADSVYFVHSFVAKPSDPALVLADGLYGSTRFCAVVRKGNIMGCQFHPERSGPVGLSILRNFVNATN
jgi:glutamine amidotransferase